MRINIDALIVEVRKRPSLYDSSNKDYHDRRIRKMMWVEVCSSLRSPEIWNAMNATQKLSYEKEVMTKWNSLRTCFRRQLRRNRLRQDKKKKYIYFNDLLFLLPFTKVFPVECSVDNQTLDLSDLSEEDNEANVLETQADKLSDDNYEEPMITVANLKGEAAQGNDRNLEASELSYEFYDEDLEISRDEPVYNVKRKRTHESNDRRQKREDFSLGNGRLLRLSEIDEDEAFLCSLLPSIKEFSTEEKLQLRIELLTTILNFKKSNSGSTAGNS